VPGNHARDKTQSPGKNENFGNSWAVHVKRGQEIWVTGATPKTTFKASSGRLTPFGDAWRRSGNYLHTHLRGVWGPLKRVKKKIKFGRTNSIMQGGAKGWDVKYLRTKGRHKEISAGLAEGGPTAIPGGMER